MPRPDSSLRQPTYGNGRCVCGHLSDRHACDHEACDDSCFDCSCEAFCSDGTALLPEARWTQEEIDAIKVAGNARAKRFGVS